MVAPISLQQLNWQYRGRRVRRITGQKNDLLKAHLGDLRIPDDGPCPATEDLFPDLSRSAELWLEAGFGGGEHLVELAIANPHTAIIGCEPYESGHANLIKNWEKQQQSEKPCDNIRLAVTPVEILLSRLPQACLSRFISLFPDPWPKRRHHKRRMFSAEMVDNLARVLKPGAYIHAASDHPDMADWLLWHLRGHGAFTWRHKGDWMTPPADWPDTRYQSKAMAGAPVFLIFERI